jgi:hypothetical protein
MHESNDNRVSYLRLQMIAMSCRWFVTYNRNSQASLILLYIERAADRLSGLALAKYVMQRNGLDKKWQEINMSDIPNLDPSRKKINVIARLEAFVNNPNIKSIGITTYERGFVVIYEKAESDLMESGGQGQKENISLNISHAFSETA